MIPHSRPSVGPEEEAAAVAVIRSGHLSAGARVAAFERALAGRIDVRHAVAVSSGTAALHLALLALGVGPGDEVITVSHSYIATANVVRHTGAVPVFVDIDPETFNMDPALAARAITARTKAILCVHQIGMPCDIRALVALGHAHGLKVIEDAACAAGSLLRDASAGTSAPWEAVGRPHGDVACFSFHPRKLLSTGDGGMLTTRDAALDQTFRLLRQHGMSVSDTVRHASRTVIQEAYPIVGYNYRMTDIQAAVGREQLRRLPAMVARRRLLAARYQAGLAAVPGLTTPLEPDWARTNWQSFAVRVETAAIQHAVMQALLDRGIATRRGVMNAHREAAYPHGSWVMGPGGLGHSERAQDTAIVLPLFHQLTDDEQDRVMTALAEAVAA